MNHNNECLKSVDAVFQDLFDWCRQHDFAGYDPFDALNSRLFRATPLTRSRTARLFWTQALKRFPLNLRPLLGVPQQRNAKGIALFALAALANYLRQQTTDAELEARYLLDTLIEMRIRGFSGAAWGYNFDWQSRNFFAPCGTPTIVPTAFAARALIEGARIFADQNYLQFASSACDFILRELPVTQDEDAAICFGYTPRSDTRIFNASLLAAEALAGVAHLTREPTLCNWVERATRYVVKHQLPNGSWTYGADAKQSWIDNFHTAFVLYALARIVRTCKLNEHEVALQRGYQFWRERFFLADGWPKYYDDTPYPADAHAAASAIVTLLEFRESDSTALSLAERVAFWAIRHLRDRRGFFYYQRRRFFTVKIPFMRWSEGWMLYALGSLMQVKGDQNHS